MEIEERGILCSKEESDCKCWGALNSKDNLSRLYFKLPKIKDDELRIKILHVGLCKSDWYAIQELWGPSMMFPLIPGHEIVGEVEKIGKEVKEYKEGETICVGVFRDCCGSCELCLEGMDNLCEDALFKYTYDPMLGGYSTVIQIKEKFVFKCPTNLDISKVAPIMCAGVTTFSPLKRFGKEGYKCGVIGIGGLGHMAIMMANKLGMKVYAISSSKEKEIIAKQIGAKEFILSSDKSQMTKLKSQRLDLIINTAMIGDINDYLDSLKPGKGIFVQTGIPDEKVKLNFNLIDFVCRGKQIVGSLVGSRKTAQETLEFCSKNNITPICENFSWADFPVAYDKLAKGQGKLRCVVDVAKTYDNN